MATSSMPVSSLFCALVLFAGCTESVPGPPGPAGPQGLPSAIAPDAGLTGDGSADAPLAVAFAGSGNAPSAARSDHAHEGTAGPNLLADTLLFRDIPSNWSNLTVKRHSGPWTFSPYGAVSSTFTVEAPPQELLDIVQAGSPPPSPRSFNVLHLRISPGSGGAGRLLQKLAASDKSGPVTMSAYVKVLAGTLTMGEEQSWAPVSAPTWTRVSVTTAAPTRTLGGAFGFAGSDTTFTEALIALPKVELGPAATPYIEGPASPLAAECNVANSTTNIRMMVTKSQVDTVCAGVNSSAAAVYVPWHWSGRTGTEICQADTASSGRKPTCEAVKYGFLTIENGFGTYDPANGSCSAPVGSPWPWATGPCGPNSLNGEWATGFYIVCCRP